MTLLQKSLKVKILELNASSSYKYIEGTDMSAGELSNMPAAVL